MRRLLLKNVHKRIFSSKNKILINGIQFILKNRYTEMIFEKEWKKGGLLRQGNGVERKRYKIK
jgi:hypothetical protein